jgi:obg-like ATPase 1
MFKLYTVASPWKKKSSAFAFFICSSFISKMAPKKEAVVEKVLLGRPSNNLKIGVVGLPNVGKSTLFNALTNSGARAENFPFCTIDPEEARVAVPDERFDWLCESFKPSGRVPAYLTVIDIAGLVKGAAEGLGLGNAFLSHIRAVDGIFHVVRAFNDEEVLHVEGDVNPVRDLEIIVEELRLKDSEFLGKQLEMAKKALRGHETDKQLAFEAATMQKVHDWVVVEGRQVRHGTWTAKEVAEVINSMQLLTAKSVVFLVNISEKEFLEKKNRWLAKIKAWIDEKSPGDVMIPFSGALEAKLGPLAQNEHGPIIQEAMEEWKIATPPTPITSVLPKIITTGYSALQLMYFFTAGPGEVRAWTCRKGSKAPQAAGVIHTDFERGFIMAEVMRYDDLKEANGSESAVKAAGKYLQKGREYVVEDGDVIFFKFNVTSSAKKK